MVTLITGGSRGIGFAIAKRLLPQSSKMLLCSKSEDNMEKALKMLENNSTEILTHCVDHTKSFEAAKETGEWAKQNVSQIDLLVLNAGYYVEGCLADISIEDFEENIRINFSINHYLVQELLPLVKKSTLKRIIIIGSTAAYEPYPAVPTYGVTKWALRGYAMNLRRELIADKIGVTFLAPGGTLTDMWEGEDLPPKRLLEPDDIAKIVEIIPKLSEQAVIDEIIVKPMLGDIHE